MSQNVSTLSPVIIRQLKNHRQKMMKFLGAEKYQSSMATLIPQLRELMTSRNLPHAISVAPIALNALQSNDPALQMLFTSAAAEIDLAA